MLCSYILLLLFVNLSNSARILSFSYIAAVSHQKVFQAINKQLSLSGHEVIAVATIPLNDANLTNLTEIDASIGYQAFERLDVSNMRREVLTIFQMNDAVMKIFFYSIEFEMKIEKIQELLQKPTDYFDLVLVEADSPIMYGFLHKFEAPLVAVSTLAGLFSPLYEIGVPQHPILYPQLFSELGCGPFDIWQKIDSLFVTLVTWFQYEYTFLPMADKIARTYFGDDIPYLGDLIKNVSLVFLNANPIMSLGRPYPPNVLEYHVGTGTKIISIPSDLQDILDSAKNGVVYFSLGTNVRFDHVQGDIKKTILQALGELPYTVLCKWESEDFPGKPKNVVLRKWFPQQSILAHPNVKVFVTQGGLQSSEEAISNGIPLVVIPFLGDQPMNARILTTHGMAETILPKALDKDVLKNTILKVAKEEKYRQKAKELRSIFLDQPQSGVDKIVWWCEYVIRHKGAKHLRSPGADIPLYEYFMLDVLAVILGALFVIYKVISLALRTLLGLFKSGKKVKQKKN